MPTHFCNAVLADDATLPTNGFAFQYSSAVKFQFMVTPLLFIYTASQNFGHLFLIYFGCFQHCRYKFKTKNEILLRKEMN